MSQGLEKFEVAQAEHPAYLKCISEHKHARNSSKVKEIDLAIV
jgi:hypothetical protein